MTINAVAIVYNIDYFEFDFKDASQLIAVKYTSIKSRSRRGK